MKAYLSIDLDYWNDKEFPEHLFNRLFSTRLPIYVVNDHHHLVPHIRQFEFDTLINIDYHSDLADRDAKNSFKINVALDCGTWVNHIKGIGKHYIWSHPLLSCYYDSRGTCHGDLDPFDEDALAEDYGIGTEELVRWTKVSQRLRYFPRYCDIVAIGIAASEPDYTEDHVTCCFLEWLWEHRRSRIKIHPSVRKRLNAIQWQRFDFYGEHTKYLAKFGSGEIETFDELERSVSDENALIYEVQKMKRFGVQKMRAACCRAYKRLTGKKVPKTNY